MLNFLMPRSGTMATQLVPPQHHCHDCRRLLQRVDESHVCSPFPLTALKDIQSITGRSTDGSPHPVHPSR